MPGLACSFPPGIYCTFALLSTRHSISNVASRSIDLCHRIGGITIGPFCSSRQFSFSFSFNRPEYEHFRPIRFDIATPTSTALDSYDSTLTPVIVDMVSDPYLSVFRWTTYFTYTPVEWFRFVDLFQLNDEWPFLQVQLGHRLIKRGYMNKSPQIQGPSASIILFHKNRLYRIDHSSNSGYVITSQREVITIPGLSLSTIIHKPYTSIYSKPFDFHVMLVVLTYINDMVILESRMPALTSVNIIHAGMKIEVHAGIFSYTSMDSHSSFLSFCNKACNLYSTKSASILDLFSSSLLTPFSTDSDPQATHHAIAYSTWFRGSRENQRTWPPISTHPINSYSIEFPKNSRHWYTPPTGYFVGLNLRYDDHPDKYIPKLYKDDTSCVPSHLNAYLNNTTFTPPPLIPVSVRKAVVKLGGKNLSHPYAHAPHTLQSIRLRSDGSIMSSSLSPSHIVFNNIIVSNSLSPLDIPKMKAQLLDRNWNRSMILTPSSKWITSSGPKIDSIITLPWYYKQIIHDYHKLNRLRPGPLIDLMHIGIVDPHGSDIITFPLSSLDDLYISSSLETHRIVTFKFQPDVYDEYSVSQQTK